MTTLSNDPSQKMIFDVGLVKFGESGGDALAIPRKKTGKKPSNSFCLKLAASNIFP